MSMNNQHQNNNEKNENKILKEKEKERKRQICLERNYWLKLSGQEIFRQWIEKA